MAAAVFALRFGQRQLRELRPGGQALGNAQAGGAGGTVDENFVLCHKTTCFFVNL